MMSFLERYASLPSLKDLVLPRRCMRTRKDLLAGVEGLEADDLATAVPDVEAGGVGMPVLLRQYLKLGESCSVSVLTASFLTYSTV